MKNLNTNDIPWYGVVWKTLLVTAVLFAFSFTTANAQTGETCDDPIVVSSLPYTASGSLADYGNNYSGSDVPSAEAPDGVFDGTGSTGYLDGYDAVYTYTPSSNEIITISTELDIDDWHSIYVFTGCPFSTTVGYHTDLGGDSRIIEDLPVTANETYYIVVSDWYEEELEYTIEISALEDCTDADAGVAMDDFSACSGVAFTLENDGASEGNMSGLSYQWEESEDNNNWSDIDGAESVTYTAEDGVESDMYYRLTVGCEFGGADTSEVISVSLNLNTEECYCIPVGSSNNSDEIRNFTLNNIDNDSEPSEGLDGPGYSDYTETVSPANLVPGEGYIASLTSGAGSGNHGAAIWIDYNDNGIFEAFEKVAYLPSSIGANATFDFPEFIVENEPGLHRLRVQYAYSKNGADLDPCVVTTGYSETEDYMVDINTLDACTNAIAGTLTTQDMSICAGNPFTLEAEGDSDAAEGLTKQWMSSVDGGTDWSAIDGATGSSYTVSDGISEETQFKYEVSCANDNSNDETGVVTISLNPGSECYCEPEGTNSSRYIDNFSAIGDGEEIDNQGSGFSDGGYGDFTDMIVSAEADSEISFEADIVGGNAGFRIWVDWNNDGSFDTEEEVAYQSSGYSANHEGSFEVPGNADGTYRMRIVSHWLSTSGDIDPCETGFTYGEFEDYTVEVAPVDCPKPTGLTVSNIGTNEVDLDWDVTTTANQWDVYVVPTNPGTPDETTTPTDDGVQAHPYRKTTGLAPNSTYDFYVRADCDMAGNSSWAGPVTFTTACTATDIPFTQDFEGVATPDIPNCASLEVNNGNAWKTSSTTSYGFNSQVLMYSYHSGGDADSWYFTQGINLEANVDYQISYQYGNNSTSYTELLKVAFGTSPSSSDMTEELADQEISLSGSDVNEITFSVDADEVYYFGFQAHSPSNEFYLYIDNINIDVAPTCPAPFDLAIDNITDDGAEFSWTTTANQSDIWITQSGNAPDDNDPPSGGMVTSPTIMTGLDDNTAYEVYVRADCGAEDGLSVWAGPISFTTLATPPDNDSCDDAMALECDAEPITVSSVGSTAESPDGCTISDNGIWFSFVGTGGDITINSSASFDHKMSMQSGTCDDLSFIACKDGSSGDETYTVEASVEDEMYYVYVAHYSSYTSSMGDISISIECAAPILCPAPTDLAVDNITAGSADFSWTTDADQSDVYLVVAGDPAPDENSTPTESGVTSPTTLDNLTDSSAYDVYVRNDCGDQDGVSTWTGPVNFNTECEVISDFPWTESFEDGGTKACWTQEHVSGTSNWNLDATANGDSSILPRTGDYMAEFKVASFGGEQTKMISPILDLSSLSNPELEFYFANVNWDTDIDELRVYYKTSASGDWVQIGDNYLTSHTSWTQVILELPEPSSTYYIAFEGKTKYARGLDIDDITVSESGAEPADCEPPTDIVFGETTFDEDGAHLPVSWTLGGTEDQWEVSYENTGDASDSGLVTVNNDPETILVLQAGEGYEIKVRAVCDASTNSEWSETKDILITLPVEFDCPDIEANIGDDCEDADGNSGEINEDCECEVEPVEDLGCINTNQWPTYMTTPNADGSVTSINGCNYFGDYSGVTGIVSGEEYMFNGQENSSENLAFITVRSGSVDGPVVDTGTSPLTITATSDADLYVHWNADEDCNDGNECATTSVTCVTCEIPVDCENPDVSVSIVDADGDAMDCVEEDGEYRVFIELSGGSGNESYTVYDDAGDVLESDLTADGTYIAGPYDAEVLVFFTVEGNDDDECSVVTDAVEPVICVPEACVNPDVSVSVVDADGEPMDCVEEDGEYHVSIELTGGSGNESYTVYDDAGDVLESDLTVDGTYLAGPFNEGDSVSFTVEGNDDDECAVTTDTVDPDVCDVEPDSEYYISLVETTSAEQNISNSSGNDGYTDYTADEIIEVYATGDDINGIISIVTSGEEVNFGIWIDLDQNGTFGTAPMGDDNSPASGWEQIQTLSGQVDGNISLTIETGSGLVPGEEYVIRVQVKKSELSANDTDFEDGETEDYLIRVLEEEEPEPCDDPYNEDAAGSDVYISSIEINGIGADAGNTDYDFSYTSNSMSTGGYDVVANPTLTIYPGLESTYTVSSGPAGNPNQYYYSVWIDLNQDGCFDADEQFIWSNDVIWGGGIPNGEPGVEDVPFTFGQFAPGTYQARIRNSMMDHPIADGNGDGEALDFTVEVITEADAELVLGVDNQMFTDFTYYPNPVENQLNLHAGTPIEQVEVYNLLGQKVIQVQPNTLETNLDTDRLQSGVYLMNVTIDGSQKTFRIVKR